MNFREAVAVNLDAMDGVLDDAMPDLLGAIAQAERELVRFLHELPEESEGWTVAKQRGLLLQLKHLTDRTKERTGSALNRDLRAGALDAGKESLGSLRQMVDAAVREFGGVQPLRIDVAAVLASSERTLLHRMGSIANRYGERIGQRMRRELMVGILHGETLDQMASRMLAGTGEIRRLREKGELPEGAADRLAQVSRSDADRIVRTELVNAYNEVGVEGIRAANDNDPGYQKRWDAQRDARECEFCRELDNTIVEMHELFESSLGSVEHSPLHARCFIPDTRVAARVERALRVHYDGQVVEIETASGARVTVTVNHPMATVRGFVAAAELRQGDKVLSQRGDVWRDALAGRVDENHAPPRIDEVFRALSVVGPRSRRAASVLDLHGDAALADSEIEIVGSLSELRRHMEAEALELALQVALPIAAARTAKHARPRDLFPVLEWLRLAARSLMGRSYLTKALLLRSGGPLDRLSLGLPAQGHARDLEPTTNAAAADSTLVREPLERLAGKIALDEAVDILNRRDLRTEREASGANQPLDRLDRDVAFTRELTNRFPSEVFADDVVSVSKRHYSGHVYDLQTATGWIVANGIYASNCRCAVIPWRRGWSW